MDRRVQTDSVDSQQSYRRTLRYAEAIAGGVEPLASRLRVSSATLQAWSEGWQEIPDSIFLSSVDLICNASGEEIRRAREYRRVNAGGNPPPDVS